MRQKSPKLVCQAVWKIYGDFGKAQQVLDAQHWPPSPSDLDRNNLIGAVQEVTLEVNDGEIFVIMGLSGSGKSTLVRCMSRLIEPTKGKILFNGEDLLQKSNKEMIEIRRHKMGMVFQHFALLPHLTVLGNVAFPLEVQGISRAEREERARKVIELVGLQGREDYFPRELSGGQQQRVGIARSLAVEPELWFLDEPFSALDPLIRREMQDEFLRLQNLLRKTIVFITHDFDEAIRLADRIAIMKDGAVDQIGTPEDIVLRPATDYVAEFTRDVSRAKVLSVSAIMQAAPARAPKGGWGGRIPGKARIAEIASQLKSATSAFAVVDDEDQIIGQLSRGDVVDVLMQG
jgi:glycine betaine/proline transport system ATP-binding protein